MSRLRVVASIMVLLFLIVPAAGPAAGPAVAGPAAAGPAQGPQAELATTVVLQRPQAELATNVLQRPQAKLATVVLQRPQAELATAIMWQRPQTELATIVWPAVETRFVAALVLTLGPKSVGTPTRTIEEAPAQAFASELNEPLPIAIRDFDRDGDFSSAAGDNFNTTAALLASGGAAFDMSRIPPQFLSARAYYRQHGVHERQPKERSWNWARLSKQPKPWRMMR